MNRKNVNEDNILLEEKIWVILDKLRGYMDASEYKIIVLGLIFLKYISDAFQALQEKKQSEIYADPDDPDEYIAENVFWIPREALWPYLQANARQSDIGQLIDRATMLVEKENPSLKGVLPKDYARLSLDKQHLGELIDLIATIGLGDHHNDSINVYRRVYESFLERFAAAEGKKGGEFYTPPSVSKLLVELFKPLSGRIYDPCCGVGGIFVQLERFIKTSSGQLSDISIYGQESNSATWCLCKMNLAIQGIDGNIGSHHADSFYNDLHRELKADYIMANPPFNISNWGGERLQEDARWKYGIPPVSNANYAWILHIIHHLAPNGVAGFILPNSSVSSTTSSESEIRRTLIEADLVECVISLPSQLFYSTQIPVCMWLIAQNKTSGKFRNRNRQFLFIDAGKLGHPVEQTHRELSDQAISRIAQTYHAWCQEEGIVLSYQDELGFCKSVNVEEVALQNYVLTPSRYVGNEEAEGDDELFEEKMARLTTNWEEQFKESELLGKKIREHLQRLGYVI